MTDKSEVRDRYETLAAAACLIGDDGSLWATVDWLGERIATLHRRCLGCTTGWNGEPIDRGFAVARREPRLVRPELTPPDVTGFFRRHARMMRAARLVPGTWRDQAAGIDMILCTRVFESRDAAVAFGRRHGQRYAWDLSTNHAVPILPPDLGRVRP